ncbi:MAG: FMN-binding glutamate synthase family protein, partial [Solirubrobacteraceae bacterium]|nr:FMN-binding glutamate synthase family protein [Solirubrobacteraceae bacterium]
PELRQYIVTSNDEERPFSRDQRAWVYTSSKAKRNTFGFGSDNDMEQVDDYLVIKHAPRPWPAPEPGRPGSPPAHLVPALKVLGAAHGRARAFRPLSVVNVSGMSFGALSGPAVEALNRGAAAAPCLQTTGEGGLAPAHCHGGELVFQIGTGYFGCRDAEGRFDLARLQETVAAAPVRALEIKLSQGAKPGLGGMLPGRKVTPEIATIRGVQPGVDCISPPRHSAFQTVPELCEFVERIADATGLPVGIKSAVGDQMFWDELAAHMARTGTGPDAICIDGGEGGTGAAPLAFTDHVALPFKLGFSRVYTSFARAGLADDIVFIGSGRLGLPGAALFAFAMGCDMINVGREAMLSIGCIQSQRCHTDRCPTGVATQNRWLTAGLDPELKSVRAANYIRILRAELLALAGTCGLPHPALVGPERLEILSTGFRARTVREVFGYEDGWLPEDADRIAAAAALMQTAGAPA